MNTTRYVIAAILVITLPPLFLYWLLIHPFVNFWRGKGIGLQTLRFIEGECRARGLHAVRLEVERSNRRARQVYERAGFSPHDRDIMTKWLDR